MNPAINRSSGALDRRVVKRVILKLNSAKDLVNKDSMMINDLSDPYVIFTLSIAKVQVQVENDNGPSQPCK